MVALGVKIQQEARLRTGRGITRRLNDTPDYGRRSARRRSVARSRALKLLLTSNRKIVHLLSYCQVIGTPVTRTRTDLLQGTLDLIVLRLLRGGPANGWDITESIQLVSKGALEVNYGSVYPALRRLEARGFVKAHWSASENNRRARYYELTAKGRKQLTVERTAWERFSEALGLILRTD